MKFRLKADAIFEADDIDDAFKKLAAHFQSIADDALNDDQLIASGTLDISPA
jgi:hypothetical protein